MEKKLSENASQALDKVLASRERNKQNENRRRKPLTVGNVVNLRKYAVESYTAEDGKVYEYFVFGDTHKISEKHLLTNDNGLNIAGDTYAEALKNLITEIDTNAIGNVKIIAVNFIETAFGKNPYYTFEVVK